MNISEIKLQNFRGYSEETTISIGDLTAFVGKNDAGKSTILEAMDIFLNENKGFIKIDKEDVNKKCQKEDNNEIIISAIFENIPHEVTIDDSNKTNLKDEYLLRRDGKLEVVKKYPNGRKEKVFIKAYHPTSSECSDLLLKKQNELKSIIKSQNIACTDKKKNAVMRKAIWSHYKDDLSLQDMEIDVTKEDAKNIWEKLKEHMPLYSLFQSDRKNSDGDSEIQDPMKLAVKHVLGDPEIKNILSQVAGKVNDHLNDVAKGTLDKLRDMNPDVAGSLNPKFPSPSELKWADVFKNVSISGDEDIPINKRGSGVKRLVLLNFFRSEAENQMAGNTSKNIIYALEEPETSQHPEYQAMLINAFKKLSNNQNTQVILTTHSPAIVKLLDFKYLRLVGGTGIKKVAPVDKNDLPYPSLNEVNFRAFDEAVEEYHNELYGFLESEGLLDTFKLGRPTMKYIDRRKPSNPKQVILSEYIRHQIHHPENKLNKEYTPKDLRDSIEAMKKFIQSNTVHRNSN